MLTLVNPTEVSSPGSAGVGSASPGSASPSTASPSAASPRSASPSTASPSAASPTELARDLDSTDPTVGLRAVAALGRLLEQLEALQVDNARARGWSWQDIAEALNVTKQTVHRKHSRRR